MSNFVYTPFPFNVTPASPLFQLSPIASNIAEGWAPSCYTPECVPTASWSTGLIGATLSFQFWGWDVVFDGTVKGNMSIELLRDGVPKTWDPSADTLFRSYSEQPDEFYLHNITLKVLYASPDSELVVNRARVNGSSTGTKYHYDSESWIVSSNDTRLTYSGFSEQVSVSQSESQSTYVSSKVGDTAFMRFNASALLIYGPCGPRNGLMRVTIHSRESIVNTSTTIESNDCLLFQSWGFSTGAMQELLIENAGSATLGINRFVFFNHYWIGPSPPDIYAQAVAIGLVAVFVVLLIWTCLMISFKRPQGGKIRQMFKSLCL